MHFVINSLYPSCGLSWVGFLTWCMKKKNHHILPFRLSGPFYFFTLFTHFTNYIEVRLKGYRKTFLEVAIRVQT